VSTTSQMTPQQMMDIIHNQQVMLAKLGCGNTLPLGHTSTTTGNTPNSQPVAFFTNTPCPFCLGGPPGFLTPQVGPNIASYQPVQLGQQLVYPPPPTPQTTNFIQHTNGSPVDHQAGVGIMGPTIQLGQQGVFGQQVHTGQQTYSGPPGPLGQLSSQPSGGETFLQDPTSGNWNWNMDTSASSHLNDSVHSLSDASSAGSSLIRRHDLELLENESI
jgi:hypothetical protein